MTSTDSRPHGASGAVDPRDWVAILARYRAPRTRRSLFELAVTLGPFLALWALAWAALSVSPWLAMAIALFNALFLVRVFMIQHDCGHGAFFRSRRANAWLGRALGVLTLTPYDVWRETHAIHHATTGNLDRRGIGDLPTLTVREYRALSRPRRVLYRVYRHPLVMFGVVPVYSFFFQYRLPVGLMRAGARYWVSAMATNLAIAAVLGTIWMVGGAAPLVYVFLPTMLPAAAIGFWLFYVQHQFEDTHWEHEPDWRLLDAAVRSSSYYDLPAVLRWFSGNIGVHHVHHLASRIPFYRLNEVLRDHPVLAQCQRITLADSLACVRLHLWDEDGRRMLSCAEAGAGRAPA